MKHTKKYTHFLSGALTAILLVNIVIPALAAGVEKLISVNTGVTIYMDNVKLNAPEAFIYEGTTYLPVRAISEALGLPVKWDGSTRSVYLGKTAGDDQYLLTVCPPYKLESYNFYGDIRTKCKAYYSPDDGTFAMGGNEYSYGFTMGGYSTSKSRAYFNLNGKYESITCTLGIVDNSSDHYQGISFIVDGKVVAQYNLDGSDLPFEVTVPLNYGLQLQIATVDGKNHYGAAGIGDITVK